MKTTFDTIISSKRGWFDINVHEILKYKDLIFMFVIRNFIANYKQTILGPAWAIIQPLLTTVVFTIVFGNLAKLSTDGVPPFLFYMCGNVAWGYFSGCLNQTATTFTTNAAILGKVYFPRLVMPISSVIGQLIQFSIQFIFFIFFIFYYSFINNTIYITWSLFFLPLLILQMAILGLGCGIIISSLTTKYRDLHHLVGFGIHLWMYATPIVYTLDTVPSKWRTLYLLNPMAVIIELFKNIFFNINSISYNEICISWIFTVIIAFFGIILFNQIEKTFMDTI